MSSYVKIPSHLKPSDPQGSDLLAQERATVTFDVKKLTLFLYGKKNLDRYHEILRIVENDPAFDKTNVYFMGRNELFKHALKKEKRLVQLIKENEWKVEQIQFAEWFLDMPGPFGVHRGMFIPTLISQGTEEQKKEFLIPALQYKILGCYAQTELGHGSNVQGLETTAIYISETDEFEIHSPYLTASKWWIGGLGKTANHAIVMAQLKSNGKTYGPHLFVVQIRDMETHQPLPGITIGDIGPKFGFNSIDNGFVLFDHVRIPRFNMLSKFSQIKKGTGEYINPPNDKLSYGSMVLVRAIIISSVRFALGRAATIAIRYSAVRRQFVDKEEPKKLKDGRVVETSILDYTMQQYRLFPVVAQAYACIFTAKAMTDQYAEYTTMSFVGDYSLLTDLHASSSGLKSLTTTMAVDSIEECRRACGGHGYSSFSGFVKFYQDYLPNTTWEGDNYILTQQTARHTKHFAQFEFAYLQLFKTFRKILSSKGAEAHAFQSEKNQMAYILQYLNDPNHKCTATTNLDFKNPELQLRAFGHRAAYLIANAVDQIDNHNRTWNSMLIEINRISRAHCQYLMIRNFILAMQNSRQSEDEGLRMLHGIPSLKEAMLSICNLFALHTMEKDLGDFMECEYLIPSQAKLLKAQIYNLLKEIRPNAVGLVDAFLIPDFLLLSAIGRYDGKVYETMIDWASKEPLNGITLNVNPDSDVLFRNEKSYEIKAKL
ncbi:3243_t:CDS:2 [Funneliformis geosporum]|uniref:Acyl-coenzyme A oxidase n=1 Tax=Funneliformis geosporum TaxID=1117311 RepID=A0A9W4WRL0_9GLOM|nr:15402_t:CDS:2 [Funneliformis geosporum]CAI2171286.1 3243_t:CDS:2 [Funneliformis geosporum]